MAEYSISFTKSADKEFRKLPGGVQRRFSAAFERLVEDPHHRRAGCDVLKLEGVADSWRLRVGRHRGIYSIEGAVIVFTRFGPRGNVYRP